MTSTLLRDGDLCEAGKRADFGGRWTEPCFEQGIHAIANPEMDPILLCDRHFREIYAAGLVGEPNIGFEEFLRREEERARGPFQP